MPFAELKDVRIHYDLSGPADAPVLVFSNSLGADLSMWDSQMPALRSRFRVLRYDTRGHGRSSVTPGPYTIEQLSQDVLSLLDFLEIGQYHFCGLSMGGMTGMSLALGRSPRIQKLILANTAVKIGTPESWNARIDSVQKLGMHAISATAMARWFTPAFLAARPEVVTVVRRMLESTSPDGYVANCAAVRDFDGHRAVSGINPPALVIAGTHDPATTIADGQFLAREIKGARLVELNASHLSNIEAHKQFTSALTDFLSSE